MPTATERYELNSIYNRHVFFANQIAVKVTLDEYILGCFKALGFEQDDEA